MTEMGAGGWVGGASADADALRGCQNLVQERDWKVAVGVSLTTCDEAARVAESGVAAARLAR